MSPQDPQAAALLAHVVSQMETNVNFLVSQNYMSQSDASLILNRLPKTNVNQIPTPNQTPPAFSRVASAMSNLSVNRAPAPRSVPPPPRPVAAPEPEPASFPQARALWSYTGDDAGDLSLAPGDIIDILEENNPDWWTGRLNGKQGLFPATYVERILAPPTPLSVSPDPSPVPVTTTTPKVYKPFGAALHGTNAPPPAGQGVNSIGLQEQGGQEAKKGKYDAYKNTLAHSAAGGVGFGAGAAIGGGLVRAIF